jgi:hypothetical protein
MYYFSIAYKYLEVGDYLIGTRCTNLTLCILFVLNWIYLLKKMIINTVIKYRLN